MAYIENETSRKTTFRKRKGGIMKKALELSTLCDVPIAVFVQSEYNSVPEVFPPSRQAMGNMLVKWEKLSLVEKTKKMMNQEQFIQQRITKATESCKKVAKENKELAMKEVMYDCLRGDNAPCNLDEDELRDLGGVIDQYIKGLNRRIQVLMKDHASSSTSVVPDAAAAAAAVAMPTAEMGSSSNVKDFDLNQTQSE
ncbi:MADS-box transcription factor PHERES 2 [Brassica rapa]|nr:MADS-box transcription factor PHERES 2 [Brassica rapa]